MIPQSHKLLVLLSTTKQDGHTHNIVVFLITKPLNQCIPGIKVNVFCISYAANGGRQRFEPRPSPERLQAQYRALEKVVSAIQVSHVQLQAKL